MNPAASSLAAEAETRWNGDGVESMYLQKSRASRSDSTAFACRNQLSIVQTGTSQHFFFIS
eukprot:m.448285 g.448285  ORF g.448285 m.448285 type:complete len:61 (-) comp19637_c0_seq1:1202-1384(-)